MSNEAVMTVLLCTAAQGRMLLFSHQVPSSIKGFAFSLGDE
jgi:hypothetical protein